MFSEVFHARCVLAAFVLLLGAKLAYHGSDAWVLFAVIGVLCVPTLDR